MSKTCSPRRGTHAPRSPSLMAGEGAVERQTSGISLNKACVGRSSSGNLMPKTEGGDERLSTEGRMLLRASCPLGGRRKSRGRQLSLCLHRWPLAGHRGNARKGSLSPRRAARSSVHREPQTPRILPSAAPGPHRGAGVGGEPTPSQPRERELKPK